MQQRQKIEHIERWPSRHDGETQFSVSTKRLSGLRDEFIDQVLRCPTVRTQFYTGSALDRCDFGGLVVGILDVFNAVRPEDGTSTVSPPPASDAIPYLIWLFHGFTAMSGDIPTAILPKQPTGVQ